MYFLQEKGSFGDREVDSTTYGTKEEILMELEKRLAQYRMDPEVNITRDPHDSQIIHVASSYMEYTYRVYSVDNMSKTDMLRTTYYPYADDYCIMVEENTMTHAMSGYLCSPDTGLPMMPLKHLRASHKVDTDTFAQSLMASADAALSEYKEWCKKWVEANTKPGALGPTLDKAQ